MISLSPLIIGSLVLPVVVTVVIWPPPDVPQNLTTKPRTWVEKNLGQWCRNLTHNLHRQCPQGSAFHQFDCCGLHNIDCCFALQGWVTLIALLAATVLSITFVFYLLLKLQIICVEASYAPKTIYLNVKG